MKPIALTAIFLNIVLFANAQVYYKGRKNRYTFAQTTIGYNLDFTPAKCPGGWRYAWKIKTTDTIARTVNSFFFFTFFLF